MLSIRQLLNPDPLVVRAHLALERLCLAEERKTQESLDVTASRILEVEQKNSIYRCPPIEMLQTQQDLRATGLDYHHDRLSGYVHEGVLYQGSGDQMREGLPQEKLQLLELRRYQQRLQRMLKQQHQRLLQYQGPQQTINDQQQQQQQQRYMQERADTSNDIPEQGRAQGQPFTRAIARNRQTQLHQVSNRTSQQACKHPRHCTPFRQSKSQELFEMPQVSPQGLQQERYGKRINQTCTRLQKQVPYHADMSQQVQHPNLSLDDHQRKLGVERHKRNLRRASNLRQAHRQREAVEGEQAVQHQQALEKLHLVTEAEHTYIPSKNQ